MPIDKKKICELEKALFEKSKLTIRQKAALKCNLAKAKIIGKQKYQETLTRYVGKYLGAIPSQGSIPGLKKVKKGSANAAVNLRGSTGGLACKTSVSVNAAIGSQGPIKGLCQKKKNKRRVKRAIPPQGGIKGMR